MNLIESFLFAFKFRKICIKKSCFRAHSFLDTESMLQKTIKMLLLSTPVISAVLSNPANAWGQNGHRIIGEIASKHITYTTKQALVPLLDGDSL